MPEGQEVETDKLSEAIHEKLEQEGGGFLKVIALTTAFLAALRAGDTVNEALVLKTEATRLQAEASDQWAYYQAKGIKSAVHEASRASWLALGKEPPVDYSAKIEKYAAEQKEIEARAHELETQRSEKSREADELLHRHHAFATAVALFQVAIALGAVAALTRNRPVWWASLVLGALGAASFLLRLSA